MLVGWWVLVGDTTASKVPTFPNPRNPEGQPQALLYLCFVQFLVRHSKLVDPTPLENMVDFAQPDLARCPVVAWCLYELCTV